MFITKKSWHNTVMFVVLTPNVVDRNGDVISEDEIVKTAHEFMINLAKKTINIDHQDGTDLTENDAQFVGSFVSPVDLVNDNGDTIEKWSRLVWIKFSDALYQDVLDGKISGISMEGQWVKQPL